MPLRLTPVRVARPLPFVVGQVTTVAPPQTAVPWRLKLMVLLGTGFPPAVSVAVSVAVPPYVPVPETNVMLVACAFPIVNVLPAPGVSTLPTLSVARDCTVYVPSAGGVNAY